MEATTIAARKKKTTKWSNEAHLAAISKLTATDVVMLAGSLGISPLLLLTGCREDDARVSLQGLTDIEEGGDGDGPLATQVAADGHRGYAGGFS